MKEILDNKYYIWLSSIEKITPIIKIKLLNKFKNPETIFCKTKDEIIEELKDARFNELSNKKKEEISESLKNEKTKNILDNKILSMKKIGINVLTCDDIEYPKKLKRIYDYPICIYYKGNIEILKNNIENKNIIRIAIIGCREYSKYGEKIASKFSYELSNKGIVIVSGCARGIDSFAHKAALLTNMNAKTIAVLGSGLDYIYPPENKLLEEQIIKQNGLIISEYIIGTKPNKLTFPARNRIISAISDGVLVIEAKEKSGTLITVDFALEQGKNIYAIPGYIGMKNSNGTNELIKQGAKLVTNIQDILEDFIY